ncbi:hypothetical protein Pelo_16133 [Pelomyxa schiedti]|nr:hypothetical protein Pelo_16133 [Pelomyxa schiedti]
MSRGSISVHNRLSYLTRWTAGQPVVPQKLPRKLKPLEEPVFSEKLFARCGDCASDLADRLEHLLDYIGDSRNLVPETIVKVFVQIRYDLIEHSAVELYDAYSLGRVCFALAMPVIWSEILTWQDFGISGLSEADSVGQVPQNSSEPLCQGDEAGRTAARPEGEPERKPDSAVGKWIASDWCCACANRFATWRELLREARGVSFCDHHIFCDSCTSVVYPLLFQALQVTPDLKNFTLLKSVDAWSECFHTLVSDVVAPAIIPRISSLMENNFEPCDPSRALQPSDQAALLETQRNIAVTIAVWQPKLQNHLNTFYMLTSSRLSKFFLECSDLVLIREIFVIWQSLFPQEITNSLLLQGILPRISSELVDIPVFVELSPPVSLLDSNNLKSILVWTTTFAEAGKECWSEWVTMFENSFFARWLLSLQAWLQNETATEVVSSLSGLHQPNWGLLANWYSMWKQELSSTSSLMVSTDGFLLHFHTALQLIDSVLAELSADDASTRIETEEVQPTTPTPCGSKFPTPKLS